MRLPRPTYNTSVFINCPFDAAYQPLFRALVFTVEACGFRARCALEVDDSAETRAAKLLRIIQHSQFGIHDLSRTEVNEEGLPRFNMPYEFGLFVGMKAGGIPRQAKKTVLVLDREKYRYQKFLSDIAGQDIRSHGGTTSGLIREVRGWLASKTERSVEGAAHLIDLFSLFVEKLPPILRVARKTEADLDNFYDFHQLVYQWLAERREG